MPSHLLQVQQEQFIRDLLASGDLRYNVAAEDIHSIAIDSCSVAESWAWRLLTINYLDSGNVPIEGPMIIKLGLITLILASNKGNLYTYGVPRKYRSLKRTSISAFFPPKIIM